MSCKEKKILVSVVDDSINRELLKALRKKAKYGTDFRKNMSRRQLSTPMGVGEIQISRYESTKESIKQLPTVEGFKKMCLKLQVDPCDLLGLVWIKGNDDTMELVGKEHKFCSQCGALIKVDEDEH